jgi:hypothetical protein
VSATSEPEPFQVYEVGVYTHCNAAYGGWNDVRKVDPNNILGLERLAYVTGATADFDGRPVLADVQTPGTSAFREVAIVYSKDLNDNSGSAFSTTPGHFQDFIAARTEPGGAHTHTTHPDTT